MKTATPQVPYSIRSARLLCEQLDYKLLLRRFPGLSIDRPTWYRSSVAEMREPLFDVNLDRNFRRRPSCKVSKARLPSNEQFSVEGVFIGW